MATTIEKFVFEASENGSEQDFTMPADARVVYTKINNKGDAAFYAIIDDSQPMVTRRFAVYHSRCPLPPNWVYVGTNCNGQSTYHVGEVIVTN